MTTSVWRNIMKRSMFAAQSNKGPDYIGIDNVLHHFLSFVSMKTILACFLIITTLTSATAWAWDSHPESLTGHIVAMETSATGAVDTSSQDPACHDHYCCHGAAHLLALHYLCRTVSKSAAASVVSGCNDIFISRNDSPALRPPRS